MTKSKIIVGIDLGSTKIVTLTAQVNDDSLVDEKVINVIGVSQSDSKGIKKGQIVDIDEAVGATIFSVEAAERMAGYSIDKAFVAIGGAHIHSQNSHGVVAVSNPEGEIGYPDVERAIDAARAISLPTSREVLHVLPREFTVDGESGVKDPIGMSGVRLEVDTHIVTAASAYLKNVRKVIGEAGINIEDLVFAGLASSEAVLTPTEKELGCVVIDMGGGVTSVAVWIDGSLCYSGVIPVGAKNVTNDLAIGLRVSLDVAERIKLMLSSRKKLGESDEVDLGDIGITEIRKISRKTLLEGIIKPRLNEIFTMIKIELEKEGLLNKIPSGAIITGGGAEVIGITESAKRMLNLPVRIGIPHGVSGLIDDIMNPSFSVSVGLLKYAAKHSSKENLTSLSKKIKLPTKGVFGKIVSTIKDLLP